MLILPITLSIAIDPRVGSIATTLCLRVKSLMLLRLLLRMLLRILIPPREGRLPDSTEIVVALRSCYSRRSHKSSLPKVDTLLYQDSSMYRILEGLRLKYLNTPNKTVVQASDEMLCQLCWVVTESRKRHELIELALILYNGHSELSQVMELVCPMLLPFLW